MKPPRFPVAPAGAKPFLAKAALGAVGLGVFSLFFLFVVSGLGGGEVALPASIFGAALAMGVSLACLLVALVNGPRYARPMLSGVAWKLPLPFVTSCPVLWMGWLGYGLAGESQLSDNLGTLLTASIVLFFVVAVAGALAARRGRDSNART